MREKVLELVNWLNNFDENLINRLMFDKFKLVVKNETYEIKNSLGKILIKPGVYCIMINNMSYLSTFNSNNDWLDEIKKRILKEKTNLLLAVIDAQPKKTWWSKITYKKNLPNWNNLTKEDLFGNIVPYINNLKKQYLDGNISKLDYDLRIQKITHNLKNNQKMTDLMELIKLLET